MVSIILVSYNVAEVTINCINSIKRNVKCDYEIIVVDNASSIDTVQQLKKIEGIVLIQNERNLGFPAACNIGLMVSKGEYIWILNNDTLVPPESLENMVSILISDDNIGMVGPVTNRIVGKQRIPVDYEGADLSRVMRFAEKRIESFGNEMVFVTRLLGFSMLARKSDFMRYGGFDEKMGMGTFEDDDLSLRFLKNGLRLVIALGSFIHHIGGASFDQVGGYPTKGDENQAIVSSRYSLTVSEDVDEDKDVVEFIDNNNNENVFINVRYGCGANSLYAKRKGMNTIGIEFDTNRHCLAVNNFDTRILIDGTSSNSVCLNSSTIAAFERQIDLRDIQVVFDKFNFMPSKVMFIVPYLLEGDGRSVSFRDDWSKNGSEPQIGCFTPEVLKTYMTEHGYDLYSEELRNVKAGFFARNAFVRFCKVYKDYREKMGFFKRYIAVYVKQEGDQ